MPHVVPMTFRNSVTSFLDNILIAAAYYIGVEKRIDGHFCFIILALVTTACMILSEIIAKTRKRKINPVIAKVSQKSIDKKMVISNLIPFTRLNLIFAFSIVISVVIRLIQTTQIGVPYLSIQIVVMLICLLLSNSKAKFQFKTKCAAHRKRYMSGKPLPKQAIFANQEVVDQESLNLEALDQEVLDHELSINEVFCLEVLDLEAHNQAMLDQESSSSNDVFITTVHSYDAISSQVSISDITGVVDEQSSQWSSSA